MASIDTETVEVEEGRTQPDGAAKPDEPPAWFKDYVNRLEQKGDKPTGPRPHTGDRRSTGDRAKSARFIFKGCWHCGKEGHSRNACEQFKKLMADANKGNNDRSSWKLPKGYMGAFEKAKKKAQAGKRRVNMLDGTVGDDSGTEADEWEDCDEDLMGANYGQTLRALRPARTPARRGLNLVHDYSVCQCCQPAMADEDFPVAAQDDLVQDK